MLRVLLLLLPALMPSWRFFKAVEPSPRIEYRLIPISEHWQEARPRPAHVSLWQMLLRLFWNPHWNEALFLVSLAERLTVEPTAHSQTEIFDRIARRLPPQPPGTLLQFRLSFVMRDAGQLVRAVTFESVPEPLPIGQSI